MISNTNPFLCGPSLAVFFTLTIASIVHANSNNDADDKNAKPKQVKIGGIDWYVDYDAALKIAKQKKKPIWLHFGENPG
jgi:hypothetical protein